MNQYEKFKDTELWNALKEAINNLIKNQDIELTTHEDYVIGYLCSELLQKKIVVDQ